MLPHKWRSFGLATTEMFLIALGTFGPLTGRGLTQNVSWRWLYILGDITAVIATTGTFIFYNPPPRIFKDRTTRQVLTELDYLGIFLYTAGVTLVLLGLGWAGIQHPWASAEVVAPVVVGAILFLATFAWGFSGRAARPLIPYRLFKKFREFTSVVIIGFTCGLAHISLTTFVPQQITYVFTSDPITAGWYNVPAGFGSLIGGALLGSLVPRIRHVPYQLLIANAIQALGCGLLALASPNRIAASLVIQAIANIPFGWIVVMSYTTVGLHVPQRDIGLAYGLLGTSRYLGGAVGGTIFNTILDSKVRQIVPRRIADAVVQLGYPVTKIESLVTALASRAPARLAKIPPDVLAAALKASRWGYSEAFEYVWYASIPFYIVACVISVFVLDPSPYFTNHTAVARSPPTHGTRNRDAVSEKPTSETIEV